MTIDSVYYLLFRTGRTSVLLSDMTAAANLFPVPTVISADGHHSHASVYSELDIAIPQLHRYGFFKL
jgi:hypothetical protein